MTTTTKTRALPTATVEDLLLWGPCDDWTEEEIRGIAGEKEKWSALDVLNLEEIEPADILWVILRPELILSRLLHELGCTFAEQVLYLFEVKYPSSKQPRKAIGTKRKWLRGEAEEAELDTAKKDAWTAADMAWRDWNIAWRDWNMAWRDWKTDAVWHATKSWHAARSAAWSATTHCNSAWEACRTAAMADGSWENQIKVVKLTLKAWQLHANDSQ